jgi:signal transduction histidine kinase
LDIAQNSVTAKAENIYIGITESGNDMSIKIKDDGSGMSEETLSRVTDPFYTSRTTRRVGLGLPFFKMQAEMTGGSFEIKSRLGEGTETCATFKTDSFDAVPLGDIISTVCILIQGSPEINFYFSHKISDKLNEPEKLIELNTPALKEALGEDISLGEPEIISWIKDYLTESYL